MLYKHNEVCLYDTNEEESRSLGAQYFNDNAIIVEARDYILVRHYLGCFYMI